MNGNPPLVSIIVPIWNAERFLGEAVESVLAQTYSRWELLLVDDGSSDASPGIARSWAERHPERIRCLAHPDRANRGQIAARNLGLEVGKGDLIALLDADDVWLPEKLERQVPLLLAEPRAEWLYGNTEYWFEDATRNFAPRLGLPPGSLVEPPHLLTRFLRREATVPCNCSLLVRREAIEKSGGIDESFHRLYTDQVFYARLALTAPVLVDDGCWERYRQHPDSACAVSKKTGTGREFRRAYLTWLERTLDERGVNDPDLRRALKRELRASRHPRLDRALRRITG